MQPILREAEVGVEEALRALNALVADGVIANYAIGGAVGASFYLEALQTEDLDAFVFPPESASGLVLLDRVYGGLQAQGGVLDREYVRFGSWPVQILSDANPLIAEAIAQAIETTFRDVPTRVFRPEHLAAIAVQTGRRKDRARVAMFLEQEAVDPSALNAVLSRYGLRERLEKMRGGEMGRHDRR